MQKFFWPLLITISLAVIRQFSSVPVILCSQWTLKTRFNTKFCSVLASSKFMEHFFVKCFILVFRSCGEEDVTTNEFMDHLAVTAQTTEGYWHTLVKLYGHLESHVKNEKRFCWLFRRVRRHIPHLSYLPVHVPLLHVGKSPCGDRQPGGHVNTEHTVVRDPKNLIFLAAFKSKAQIKGQEFFFSCKSSLRSNLRSESCH